MLKYVFLLIVANVLLMNNAICQKADTIITYLKNQDVDRYKKVSTIDSADFIRIMLPNDIIDNDSFSVKEYYKDGKIKLIGKYDYSYYKSSNIGVLIGDCVTYYPNGKKESIIHYTKNRAKEGYEYWYYPNGSIYWVKNNILNNGPFFPTVINWECYDMKGTKICTDGNGKWILYDENFNITLSGDVKNGLYEGDWSGSTKFLGDSIKYIYKYNKGVYSAGIGYDKFGKSYPFKESSEHPATKSNPIIYVRSLRGNLKIPSTINGKKISSDTVHISFIIEKDGKLSDAKILGITDPELNSKLKEAVPKCDNWTPWKFYGIPLRTRMTIPYKYVSHNSTQGIEFQEETLK